MGEWLIWLILGALILIVFCIYSLSSQVERCVHLAVEIITGNQRKIMAQLDSMAAQHIREDLPDNVVPFDRRSGARRLTKRKIESGDVVEERRQSPGRRREDLFPH